MHKKQIMIILTGGTISMKNHLVTKKAVIYDGYNDILSELILGLKEINFSYHVFSLLPSPSMTPEMMFNLAKLITGFVAEKKYDGIVITHGTDTMEETGYFLDSLLDIDIPLVMTGSMRNLSELGFDGLSNLASASLVAANENSKSRGVLIVMNDEINALSEVTKTHTVALDTFKSPEFGPLGIVDQKDVLYFRNATITKKIKASYNPFLKVEIIKAYAGSDSSLIDLLLDSKINGLVIEALGRGNVPPKMVSGIKRAISLKIPVILTSKCLKGRVLNTYQYEGGGAHLESLGVIFAPHLPSSKARIRLLLFLSSSYLESDIKKFF